MTAPVSVTEASIVYTNFCIGEDVYVTLELWSTLPPSEYRDGLWYSDCGRRCRKNLSISSDALGTACRMEKANAMLGQPYRITGTVVSGRQLGRTIGIPTINQQLPEQKLLPPNGVYAAQIHIEGKTYYGITNIGCKPTVQQTWVRNVETHLFDCTENCYGKEAVVQLLAFVREEQKFDSVEALQKQIQSDILYVRDIFKKYEYNSVVQTPSDRLQKQCAVMRK